MFSEARIQGFKQQLEQFLNLDINDYASFYIPTRDIIQEILDKGLYNHIDWIKRERLQRFFNDLIGNLNATVRSKKDIEDLLCEIYLLLEPESRKSNSLPNYKRKMQEINTLNEALAELKKINVDDFPQRVYDLLQDAEINKEKMMKILSDANNQNDSLKKIYDEFIMKYQKIIEILEESEEAPGTLRKIILKVRRGEQACRV